MLKTGYKFGKRRTPALVGLLCLAMVLPPSYAIGHESPPEDVKITSVTSVEMLGGPSPDTRAESRTEVTITPTQLIVCESKIVGIGMVPEWVREAIQAYKGPEKNYLLKNERKMIKAITQDYKDRPISPAQLKYDVKRIVGQWGVQRRMKEARMKAGAKFFSLLAGCIAISCGATYMNTMLGIATSMLVGSLANPYLRAYGLPFIFPAEAEIATANFGQLSPLLQRYLGDHWKRVWAQWKKVPTDQHEAMLMVLTVLPMLENRLIEARRSFREADEEYATDLVVGGFADVMLPVAPYLLQPEVQADVEMIIGRIFKRLFTKHTNYEEEKLIHAVLQGLRDEHALGDPEIKEVEPIIRRLLTKPLAVGSATNSNS